MENELLKVNKHIDIYEEFRNFILIKQNDIDINNITIEELINIMYNDKVIFIIIDKYIYEGINKSIKFI